LETKYFRSKYNFKGDGVWNKTITGLGKSVYDVVVPAELSVILGGYYENPSAFEDSITLVFYRHDDGHQFSKGFIPVLEKYFDEMVDLTGLSPMESAEKIRSTVETYQ